MNKWNFHRWNSLPRWIPVTPRVQFFSKHFLCMMLMFNTGSEDKASPVLARASYSCAVWSIHGVCKCSSLQPILNSTIIAYVILTEPADRICIWFLLVSLGESTDKVEEKYVKLEIKVLKVQNTKTSKGINFLGNKLSIAWTYNDCFWHMGNLYNLDFVMLCDTQFSLVGRIFSNVGLLKTVKSN